jgi:solute:Na+ symporter, SSS family
MEENQNLQQQQQEITIGFGESINTSSQLEKDNFKAALLELNTREKENRAQAKGLIQAASNKVETNDKDYVFIHFILNNLPRGLIGLLLAVILSAAMSSTASELNALASTTTIDLYKRNMKEPRSEEHYVKASRIFTFLWGLIAIAFASFASLFDNLIQLVNIIGSIFYGNVLGIFLLAFFIKYVQSNAVFVAALITQVIVLLVYYLEFMEFLWLNLFGCMLVISLALLLQTMIYSPKKAS